MKKIRQLVKEALKEDIGKGDITTQIVIPKNLKGRAFILAKENGIICGLKVAELVFKILDPKIKFKKLVKEGTEVKTGKMLAIISGRAQKILMGSRTALNFLQRLSGIATLTKKYVQKVKFSKVKILDTRKTTPGLRILEKYAVRVGGGKNHRFGLWDEILIKGEHIDLVGIREAVRKAKRAGKKVEIETRNLKEVKEALETGVDIIMLDNMALKNIEKAVRLIGKRAIIEVSGGVNLDNVKKIAKTGVNLISIGNLTHSSKALNLSLKMIIFKNANRR